MKLQPLFLLGCLLACSPCLNAQTDNTATHPKSNSQPAISALPTDANISGHIVDVLTGEHIPNVSIQLKGTVEGTVADESGHFYMTNLPTDTLTLVFTMLGYDPVEKQIKMEAHHTVDLYIEMHPSAIQMGEVVISANRYETQQRLAPSIVSIVSPHQFDATASSNLAEVLNYQSGLRVEMSCQNCGIPQLRINGLDGQYSQFLLDSRPIFSSLATVCGLEQLPAAMIDRVEVTRGGGSALFGANAIGGVVNIITREPVKNAVNISNSTDVMQGGATNITTSANASVVSHNSKMGVFLFAAQNDRQAYDRNKDGYTELPHLHSVSAGFHSFFHLSNHSKLTADYHHIDEFRRGGDLIDLPPQQADIAEQMQHSINAGSLTYDYISPNHLHYLSVYSSAQHINRNSYFGTQQDPDAFGYTRDFTVVSGIQYRHPWMQSSTLPADLSGGFEHTYNYLCDQFLGYNRTIDQRTNLVGGYLQNEWHNERTSILLGARLEKHTLIAKPVLSPRVNLRYQLFKAIALRLSYASGYRAPQTYNEDLHVSAVNGEVSLISLDSALRPEYSHSLNGSFVVHRQRGAWTINVVHEVFFTQLNDVFILKEIGHDAAGNLLLQRTNSSGARTTGLDVDCTIAYRDFLNLQAGITLQNCRYIDPVQWSENANIAPQTHMFRTPDQYGYAILSYKPVSNLDIAFSGTYTGSMLLQHHEGYIAEDEEVESDPFWDMGIKLSYDIPLYHYYTLEFNIGVKNILDSFQRDLDQGATRDASYIYGPAYPRTYFAGIKLSM